MKKILSSILLLIVFSFVFPSSISAKVIGMEKGTLEIAKDEIVNEELFIGAENVAINGTVNGDVYAGGQTVQISGKINGDLHVGAANLYLSGDVTEDVYVAGGNITITKAKIGDSLIVGAGTLTLDKDTTINGSLITGVGSLIANSTIKRNLFAGAGTANIDSQIGGEARFAAGELIVGPDTKIAKDLYYVVNEDEGTNLISETASIAGQVHKVQGNYASKEEFENAKTAFSKGLSTANLFTKIVFFVGALLVGYLLLKYFPGPITSASQVLTKEFGKSAGIGFLVTFLSIPTLVLLLITILGIPLAGILFLILLILIYLSKFVVAVAVGKFLAEKMNWKGQTEFMKFALGLLVLYVLKSLPVIGFFVSLLILWLGVGAMILSHQKTASSK